MREFADKKTWLEQIEGGKATLTCAKSWAAMTGGDSQRFCDTCTKNVLNLSAMTAAEAEARLWREYRKSGEVPCVTFVVEADHMVVKPEVKASPGSRHPARLLALGLAASLPLTACGRSRPTGAPPLPAPSSLAASDAGLSNANMPTGMPLPPVDTGSASGGVPPDGSCQNPAHAGGVAEVQPPHANQHRLAGKPMVPSGLKTPK